MNFLFIADLFANQYAGGAELTLEAIIEEGINQGHKIEKILSKDLSTIHFQDFRDYHWIFGNFTQVRKQILIDLMNRDQRYSVVEFDYKYCIARSEHVHNQELFRQGGGFRFCRCEFEEHGKFIASFYTKADFIFFMSDSQKEVILRKIPSLRMKRNGSLVSQYSVWNPKILDYIHSIRQSRTTDNGKWAVLGSEGWNKGKISAIEFCQKKNLPYEVIPNLPYETFLKKLSEYKGLVFYPNAYDTCPRLVIEAKLMGLELQLNENVQMKDESWFNQDPSNLENFLRSLPGKFWNHYV